MSGIYGTVKPATINVAQDVDILYNYREDRSYSAQSNQTFSRLNASNLVNATTDGTTTIEGLYNLKLPLSIFGKKGIYTIYIKPKEINATIYAVGSIQENTAVRGVIFNAEDLEGLTGDNALVGYRIEYGDTDNSFTRIITSSNACDIIPNEGKDTFRLYSNSGNGTVNSGRLIFCTVTPSSANSFSPNVLPSIGQAGQTVKIYNTKFNPILVEVEMVEHDIETISYMLEGDQVRNLDNGVFTIYNDQKGIYRQYDAYTLKTQLGKPLYDVKAKRNIIDTSQSFDNTIGND